MASGDVRECMRIPLPRVAALAAILTLSTAAAAAAQAPTFSNYVGPTAMVGDAGEPSIGYNPKTDATFFQAYTTTAKVTGFDGNGGAARRQGPPPPATP